LARFCLRHFLAGFYFRGLFIARFLGGLFSRPFWLAFGGHFSEPL
jgi:hypothetical protein